MSGTFSRLYVICDVAVCARSGWTPADFASACFDGGATLIQLRAKTIASRVFLDHADAIVRLAAVYHATVIVNDRADIARLCGADGVHLGQDDLSPREARAVVGQSPLIGVSTHSAAQLEAAIAEPVDYVAIGPVFMTATKDSGYEAVGLSSVRLAAEVASSASLPVVAIGGITLDSAADVIAAGAASVAVISDVLATNDPAARVRAYLDRLRRV